MLHSIIWKYCKKLGIQADFQRIHEWIRRKIFYKSIAYLSVTID